MTGRLAAITMITKTNIGSVNCSAVEVLRRGAPAVGERHEQHQHDRPEAEHRLDLAEQVPDAGVRGARVREMLEVARREGVQDGEREQRGADDLERSDGRGHGRQAYRAARRRDIRKSDVSETTYLRARRLAARKMRVCG